MSNQTTSDKPVISEIKIEHVTQETWDRANWAPTVARNGHTIKLIGACGPDLRPVIYYAFVGPSTKPGQTHMFYGAMFQGKGSPVFTAYAQTDAESVKKCLRKSYLADLAGFNPDINRETAKTVIATDEEESAPPTESQLAEADRVISPPPAKPTTCYLAKASHYMIVVKTFVAGSATPVARPLAVNNHIGFEGPGGATAALTSALRTDKLQLGAMLQAHLAFQLGDRFTHSRVAEYFAGLMADLPMVEIRRFGTEVLSGTSTVQEFASTLAPKHQVRLAENIGLIEIRELPKAIQIPKAEALTL